MLVPEVVLQEDPQPTVAVLVEISIKEAVPLNKVAVDQEDFAKVLHFKEMVLVTMEMPQ